MLKKNARAYGSAAALLCLSAAHNQAQAAGDFAEIAIRFTGFGGKFTDLLGAVFFLLGICIFASGLLRVVWSRKDEKGDTWTSQTWVWLMAILVGSAMIASPSVMGTGVTTIFGGTQQTLNANGGGLRSIQ